MTNIRKDSIATIRQNPKFKTIQEMARMDTYRPDGSIKGEGWLGNVKGAGGEDMTEYSIGIDGRDIPSLVPGLTNQEIQSIQNYKITESIVNKAYQHAQQQIQQGRSPFKEYSPWTSRKDSTMTPSLAEMLKKFNEGKVDSPSETNQRKNPVQASFQMPDGSIREIRENESVASAFGKDDGVRTFQVDGGSVTMPKIDPEGISENLPAQTMGLGREASPTNAQYLENMGIQRGTPEFNRIMAGEPKPVISGAGAPQSIAQPTPTIASPQENFERRIATGQALTGREQEQAREFAASMGYEFSPTAGYIKPTMSMAAATKLTGGNRDAARGMIEQQKQGFNPLTKKTFEQEARERAAFGMEQEGFERGQERADTQLGLSQTAAQRQSERDKASDAFRERELALREDQERRLSASVSGQSERVQRQERLQKELGLSPAQALSVIEGVERIVTDPNTGQTIVYNQGTGESRELDLSPSLSAEIQKLSEPQPSQGGGLYGLVNEDITGIVPGFLEKLQGVTGSLPGVSFDVVDPEATEGRQQLRIAMQTLGRALAENPRFSEGEQQRIRKEIDIKPSVFSDPQTLRARMRAINSALEGRIDNYLEVASSSATPTSGKRDAINKITTIRNFLDDLGVPSDEKNGGGFQLSPEAQEAMKLYGH